MNVERMKLLAILAIGGLCVAAVARSSAGPGAVPGSNPASGEQDFSPSAKEANFSRLFESECAVCHGSDLEGAAQGPALVGLPLQSGDGLNQIIRSIALGNPEQGMPAWTETLSDVQISALALYIAERRQGFSYVDYGAARKLDLPDGPIDTEKHRFRIEPLVEDLDPLPFSIAPLSDGRILLVEKMRGLRLIEAHGERSDLITGTPEVSDSTIETATGLRAGVGWLMDVALHPEFDENGWIYLIHGDLCAECERSPIGPDTTGLPVSMNRLVRARIRDGAWVDEQVIWEVPKGFYGTMPDISAGGRIAFDSAGYLFFSVGLKGSDNHTGIQDLRYPWGKVHRIHSDGRIPIDNPFVGEPDAMKSVWTLGHRNPQGLEFDDETQQLWSSEMGPRGGDEINLLRSGRNYGWPIHSKGLNYNGTPVDYGPALGIELDLEEIEQPVVDLTPSPAISSLVIYRGDLFPEWRGDILVGSLKASALYRVEVDQGRLVHKETLIDGLARIRDIEVARNGEILLLLEHASGGKILRMVPADHPSVSTND